MMKKIFNAVLPALAVFLLLASCAREVEKPEGNPPVEIAQGHPVTITAGLPAETRITHEYGNSQIRPYWEAGDQVEVSFTLQGETVVETFLLKTGAGTQSATFSNDNSQLEADMRFTVDYVDKNHPDGWAIQDGTLARLPECLSGEATGLSQPVSLTPALTYFHVMTTLPAGRSFASAYLNKLDGGFSMMVKPGTAGAVTVTPEGGFSGSVDFYIAVKLEGQTSGSGADAFGATVPPKFQLAFGNGIQGVAAHGQGVLVSGDSYKYSWSPAKDYVAGKVYKIENKPFVTTTAAQAMPR